MISSMMNWELYSVTIICHLWCINPTRSTTSSFNISSWSTRVEMYAFLLYMPFFLRLYIYHISFFIRSTLYSLTTTERYSRVCHPLGLTWVGMISNVFNVQVIILGNWHLSSTLKTMTWITHHHIKGSSASHKWWGTNIIPTWNGI